LNLILNQKHHAHKGVCRSLDGV